MVEFLYHFETLVKEKKGQIIDHRVKRGMEYHCAILPNIARIQKHDALAGGIAIKANQQKISLNTFFLRKICHNGFLKPMGIFQQEFQNFQLEHFVIELYSQMEALKLQLLDETAYKFKEAKSGSNPLTLHMITNLANQIIHRTDTLQVLSHYIAEEDQRGLNPLGIYGRRLRRSQVLDRFDAANAISALARDTYDADKKWQLMELAGKIMWEVTNMDHQPKTESYIQKLYADRNSSFSTEE